MRKRDKRGSLAFQIKTELDSKLAIGSSKYIDKKNGVKNKIYSWDTYKTYLKHCNYFANYCKTVHNCSVLSDCRAYVNEWLECRRGAGLSAYTQKLEACSLAKLYNCSSSDFVKTDLRYRKNITRSRGEKERNKHFSEEKNKDFVSFCKSTGLRRAELKALTGDKLVQKGSDFFIIVDSAAKGGRYRESLVVGDVLLVVRLMKQAGEKKVFDKVFNGADIHGYRADYCSSVYNLYAKKLDTLTNKDKYFCRKDKRGVVYDRNAMLIASLMLGHNRISVIAEHYLNDYLNEV